MVNRFLWFYRFLLDFLPVGVPDFGLWLFPISIFLVGPGLLLRRIPILPRRITGRPLFALGFVGVPNLGLPNLGLGLWVSPIWGWGLGFVGVPNLGFPNLGCDDTTVATFPRCCGPD